jgi:hypothetical protein
MAAPPAEPASTTPPRRRPVAWGAGIFVVACLVFGYRLGEERDFADEWAYVAQSYFADLYLDGRRDDPAWLTYPGIDLPPGAKYVIGLALRAGGYDRPGPRAAAAWYGNTNWHLDSRGPLVAGRIPMVPLGALGCVAIFAVGLRAFGLAAGLAAAGLLMASPLYWLHARRAMSDVPCESLGLVALALGLAAWSLWLRPSDPEPRRARSYLVAFALSLLAGGFVGLSVLCKLSGTLAGMVLAAWAELGLFVRVVPWPAKLGLVVSTAAAGAVALATFTALNPTLTAHPSDPPAALEPIAALSYKERVQKVMDHRVTVSDSGRERFPDDALRTLPAKVEAVVVQGFGRFSPLGPRHSDSTHRFEWKQDWSALVWLPLVLAGAVVSASRGREQRARGGPPTAWAVLVAWVLAIIVVTSFVPLAWDRYFLPIQPGSVLLGSAAIAAMASRLRRAGGA